MCDVAGTFMAALRAISHLTAAEQIGLTKAIQALTAQSRLAQAAADPQKEQQLP
jgi:hypothetical protein